MLDKRTRSALNNVLKYLVPFLLCLLFVILALRGDAEAEQGGSGASAGVSQSGTEGKSTTSSVSASSTSIQVPFTRVSIENRLWLADLTWTKNAVALPQGEYGGTLVVTEKEGEIVSVSYEIETLGDLSALEGQSEYAYLQSAQKQDAETAQKVYNAIVDAMAPATNLTRKQRERGEEKLSKCFAEEKTYGYTLKGWRFSLSSRDQGVMRTVTFTLQPAQKEE